MATTYKSVDWTGGPIGPGWFMLFAPIAVDGQGSWFGISPQMRPDLEEHRENVVKRSKTPKEEDFALAFLLLLDD